MARMRMLKPGFFTNDELASVAPLGRLLFAGLWCIADRQGRLEDRPLRIRAEVLPYDPDTDIEALLADLAGRGFLLRYEARGHRYIQVVNFAKHQSPHVREPVSTIPAPDAPAEAPDQPDASPVLAHDINKATHQPSHAETETKTETESESQKQTSWHDSLSPLAAAEPPSPTRSRSLEPRYSADFEAWWAAYPRKREKVEASAVYDKTLKAGATVDELLAAARNYAAAADESGAEDQFIKLPATFLGPKRPWLDFRDGVPRPVTTTKQNGRRVIEDPMEQSRRVAMAIARRDATPERRALA